MEVVTNPAVLITSQFMHVSHHHLVHLKLTQCYMSIISQLNLEKIIAVVPIPRVIVSNVSHCVWPLKTEARDQRTSVTLSCNYSYFPSGEKNRNKKRWSQHMWYPYI